MSEIGDLYREFKRAGERSPAIIDNGLWDEFYEQITKQLKDSSFPDEDAEKAKEYLVTVCKVLHRRIHFYIDRLSRDNSPAASIDNHRLQEIKIAWASVRLLAELDPDQDYSPTYDYQGFKKKLKGYKDQIKRILEFGDRHRDLANFVDKLAVAVKNEEYKGAIVLKKGLEDFLSMRGTVIGDGEEGQLVLLLTAKEAVELSGNLK